MLRSRIAVLAVLVTLVAVVLGGCGGQGPTRHVGPGRPVPYANRVPTTTTEPFSPKVDGLRLHELAEQALSESEVYGVSRPENARVVVATPIQVLGLVGEEDGSQSPAFQSQEYIVALQGRFNLISACANIPADAVPASTTETSVTPVANMVIAVPTPDAFSNAYPIYVGLDDPDLSTLGHVYDLDRYIASLAATAPAGTP
jgi:hypothetical protein